MIIVILLAYLNNIEIIYYFINDLITDVRNLATLISEKISHITFKDYCERGNREVIEINALLIKLKRLF